eukprot:352825-Chlamydomonas_euryale.AAC.12
MAGPPARCGRPPRNQGGQEHRPGPQGSLEERRTEGTRAGQGRVLTSACAWLRVKDAAACMLLDGFDFHVRPGRMRTQRCRSREEGVCVSGACKRSMEGCGRRDAGPGRRRYA